MIECPIPQDILKYKARFIGNFSAREAVCLCIGGVCAVMMYTMVLSGTALPLQIKMAITAACALPAFVIGFIKPLGQPFEKIALVIFFDNFVIPVKIYKEIRHPELEKYERTHAWTKVDKNGKKKEVKIKSSKEYKAIR